MVGSLVERSAESTFGGIHGFQAWEAFGWFSLFCWIGLVGFVVRIDDDDDDDDDDEDDDDPLTRPTLGEVGGLARGNKDFSVK